jgi:hypothetical protein
MGARSGRPAPCLDALVAAEDALLGIRAARDFLGEAEAQVLLLTSDLRHPEKSVPPEETAYELSRARQSIQEAQTVLAEALSALTDRMPRLEG